LLAFYIIIVPLQELYLLVSTRSLEEKVPCWIWYCHTMSSSNESQWSIPA
jgi:hypothetical protein